MINSFLTEGLLMREKAMIEELTTNKKSTSRVFGRGAVIYWD
jgi:hypothetical protein